MDLTYFHCVTQISSSLCVIPVFIPDSQKTQASITGKHYSFMRQENNQVAKIYLPLQDHYIDLQKTMFTLQQLQHADEEK